MKTKIILCISCLVLSYGSTNAQALKDLGKAFLKGYIDAQNTQNENNRKSAERYEAEQRESYQKLREQGFDIDPNKMAEEDKTRVYGDRLNRADSWDNSTTREQQTEVIEGSLNWIGGKIDNSIIKRRTEKSEEQIAQWEREENWCALQCHRLNEETGNIEYDFECEVKCNQELRAEEASMRREEAEQEAQFERERIEREKQHYSTTQPSATIERVWVDHNVHNGYTYGMNIHVKYSVAGMLNRQGFCNAYFFFQNGNKLMDSNGQYRAADGQAAHGSPFIPPYENTTYNDFVLFMPHSELHLGIGNYNLKFHIGIFDQNNRQIATSEYTYLTWNMQ